VQRLARQEGWTPPWDREEQHEEQQSQKKARLRLERVRGKIDFDGLERVSSQTLLDILEVPQRSRTAGAYRHLAKIMAELGWTAVRVRDLTRGGYKEQVRGYCRDTRCRSTVPNRDHPTVGSSAPV
jgi:hypothetical protein